MGRKRAPHRIEQIEQALAHDPKALGPLLGKLIMNNNVPVSIVIATLDIAKPTAYRWMYGINKPNRAHDIGAINALIKLLRLAKRERMLPLKGTETERTKKMINIIETLRSRD